MLLVVLVCSLSLAVRGQQAEDDWIDPYDMLNYDPSTKTMREPTEPVNYPNVPTKRRDYSQDSSLAEQTSCDREVANLQKQIDEQEERIKMISQQPTCNPVFKRFLSRLLKEIQRVGLPSDSAEVLYDAKIKLSRQSMTEIQSLLTGEESWRTGALDSAISQILVDLKPHDYEAWKWRFEDTFGVELDTLLKMGMGVLLIMAIICTQLWSKVSWLVQFSRLFAVCFFVSIIWNWLYLYKIAFADHQKNMAKLDDVGDKCTGLKKFDWSDSLQEWFRGTMTLQDDPCKKYYEVLFVNPLLLVPPTKAISVTIVTFITEPLKHLGEGISDFIRALLKDLPVTLQIPVFVAIVLFILVFIYGSVQAAFQHGITAPFRHRRRGPPPPPLQQPQRSSRTKESHHLAGGDSQQHALRNRVDDGRLPRNRVHQSRPIKPREEPAKVVVETLRTAERPYSEEEIDAGLREAEQNLTDTENQQETQKELAGATASSVETAQSKTKPTESDPSQSEAESLKIRENLSKDELGRNDRASKTQSAERKPTQTDVQDLKASAEDRTSYDSLRQVETIGVPVQDSSPGS